MSSWCPQTCTFIAGRTCLGATVPETIETPCENFLYIFKAARRAARAAATARTPPLPLTLPLRRRQRRSAGAKITKTRAAFDVQPFTGFARGVWCPCSRCRYCPGRAEPVKSAFGVGFADLRLLTEPTHSPGDRSYREPGKELGQNRVLWPSTL